MKIKSNLYSEDKILNREITNTVAKLSTVSKFENYYLSNNLITASNPIEAPNFYTKLETLNEVKRIGKTFYKKLAPVLKEQHELKKEKSKRYNEELHFTTFESSTTNNSFINSFLPNTLLHDENIQKEFNEIILDYCKNNGIPFTDETKTGFNENNPVETVYYCDTEPFIKLSVLVYIIYSIQETIREIISCTTSKSKLGKISDMFDKSDYYSINTPLNNLQEFLWFLDIEIRNIYDLDLLLVIRLFLDKINFIENNTTYLQFKKELIFSIDYKQFSIVETHSNIASIAYEKLKIVMSSLFEDSTKECKSCRQII